MYGEVISIINVFKAGEWLHLGHYFKLHYLSNVFPVTYEKTNQVVKKGNKNE